MSSLRRQMLRKLVVSGGQVSLEDLFDKVRTGEVKELNVIMKGDAKGSVQAISGELLKLSADKVGVSIIRGAVGGITEADILLAVASSAIVVGFKYTGKY